VTAPGRLHLVRMRPRDPEQRGRVASSLELFFDLVFVVAVGFAADELHHALTEGHLRHGLLLYALAFFSIWWAWMNFSWFATSFDTDDWLYRVLTILQMSGVLVLAAGIQPAFEDGNFHVLVYGYVVMRVAMVLQWLRASRAGGEPGRAALRYAIFIAVVQVLWVLRFLLPGPWGVVGICVLVLAEISVPIGAEARHRTTWHPHHITERYGLFTLIVLGEGLLGAANAIISAIHDHEDLTPLLALSVLTLVVTAALWWIYFWPPHHELIGGFRQSLQYGYTHYFVFAAAGAFSAGVEVEIDVQTGHSELGPVAGAFCVTVPIAVFLVGVWWIAIRHCADVVVNVAMVLGALLVLLDPLAPGPIAVTAVILALVVAVLVVRPPVVRSAH
jgi:low temperature requirement protein LtrA